MITFKQTLEHIRLDIQRRLFLVGKSYGFLNVLSVLFGRGMVSVILYRLSRYCANNQLGVVTHILFFLDRFYCKNEISPMAKIGPGLVLEGMAIGIPACVVIGENCTFLGRNTITLGMIEGFDLNKHSIVIGSNCIFGLGARVMRPVVLADGTQVKPNSVVLTSVKKQGSILFGVPARRYGNSNVTNMARWSPLLNNYINEATK